MSLPAVFRNGVFQPLEHVDLPGNTPVDLDVKALPGNPSPSVSCIGKPPDQPLYDQNGKLLSLGLFGPPADDFQCCEEHEHV